MRIDGKAVACMAADKRMNATDLAAAAGVSSATTKMIFKNDFVNMQPATAGAIAAALGVKTADIIA